MEDNGFRREFDAVLADVCLRIGVPASGARLLHLHGNAVFGFPAAGLVVRISGSQAAVWQYVPEAADPPASAADLARLLRDLHSRPLPPSPPEAFTDPLDGVTAALVSAPADALPAGERDWLARQVQELRSRWDELRFPHAASLIHGDAHPGNLIRAQDGTVVLGDWDHVAVGPREWDLAQIFYTSQRLGYPAREDLKRFGAAYGWDPRDWPGLATLVAIREVSGLGTYIRNAPTQPFARRELAMRIDSLQTGDHSARWNRPVLERTQEA